MFYYQLFFFTCKQLVPRNYGDVHGIYTSIVLSTNFIMYYFNFWLSFTSGSAVAIFVLAVLRPVMYGDPVKQSIINCITFVILNILCCLAVHVFYSWSADIYVEAEVPRSSNEHLLQSLKEGVFIFEKDTGTMLF